MKRFEWNEGGDKIYLRFNKTVDQETVAGIFKDKGINYALLNRFGRAEDNTYEVVLTSIYPASEDPIPGVTSEALASIVNQGRSTPVHLVPVLADMTTRVADIAQPGDLVITLGAGSIGSLAASLVEELQRRHG